MKEKACFCASVSNMKYLWGALGLYCSLQKVKTKYPFVFLLSDGIDKQDLKKAKSIINKLDNAEYRIFKNFKKMFGNRSFNSSEWGFYCIEKLSVFTLFDYDKALLLDADIIVVKNIDSLMDEKFPLLQTIRSGNIELYNRNVYFISSYIIGVRPSDFNIYADLAKTIDMYVKQNHFFAVTNGIPYFCSDEDVWPIVYPRDKVDKIGFTFLNQNDFQDKLYHVIALGLEEAAEKYWVANNLYDYESIKDYIDNTEIKPSITIDSIVDYKYGVAATINDDVDNK